MKRRFESINQNLIKYQDLWRFEAFALSIDSKFPWQHNHAELCQWLASLTAEQIECLKADPASVQDIIVKWLPELEQLALLSELKPLPLHGLKLQRGLDSGIPGRKMEQIQSMGEAAILHHQGEEWLEWCSGKGYLGRILTTQTGQAVTSFEFQQTLCETGQASADAHNWKMHFIQGDAFDSQVQKIFKSKQHAVALHACGDLHVKLLEYGCETRLAAMTVSPCCYHLIQAKNYQPLSFEAQNSSLILSKQELRIPLQQTVTGGERVHRHRQQEMVFRLGFDLITKQVLNFKQYQPVPSIRKSQLSEGFESLCHWAAEYKGLTLKPDIDFDYFEKRAIERFWQMERLSLVQLVFQRPLEVWLALDKVLFLESRGYQVTLSEFCSKSITPRNILICANLKTAC
ncbi:methyltransferase [Vibrio sagamiensis]|nr:methyltransferase [Vibrio sagamiensis]PNQ70444.1 methyltransferase [Vibrio agarivorans]